jgi:hypothetical protein
MSRSLDDVISDLAQVTDALIATEDDDYAGLFDLLTRQDKLRAEARRSRVDLDRQRPTKDVLTELAWAKRHRDVLIRRKSLVVGPQGHGVSSKMVELSSDPDRPRGLEALTIQVSSLESLLLERGIDIEATSA